VSIIFHIATQTDWDRAQQAGEYTTSTLGRTLADEGFIHCSTATQVRHVSDAFYQGVTGLVLLVIDTSKLTAPVRYDPVPGQAEPFPHIYGPLNTGAVTEVRPFHALPPARPR
jgi:uncharacterized protein (DUF952 family)